MHRLFRKPNWDEAMLLTVWSVLVTLTGAAPGRTATEIRDLWGLDKWLDDRFPEPDERRVLELTRMLLSADGWNASSVALRRPAIRADGQRGGTKDLRCEFLGRGSLVRQGRMGRLRHGPWP